MKAKIFVTGAGALLGQGVIKSLRLAESSYHIVAADPDPRGVGHYWADTAYLIPGASAPGYLDAIRRILDRERPDAVLVGTDVELLTFARHRAQLESTYSTHVIVSPPEVINIADDKWLTYKFLQSHGLPHPRTALPENVDTLLRECDFPFVVKPRSGARSIGVHVVRNEQELRDAIAALERPVIQECVATPEEEYTSGILMTEDRVRAIVTMRRDLRDGNTYRAYVEPESPYDAFLAEVAQNLHGYGPLNLQFRVDKGIPKIFEINARFSGTTPLRAHAGFNEVDRLLRHVLTGEPILPPQLQRVVILRYWEEAIVPTWQIEAFSTEAACSNPRFDRPFDSLRSPGASVACPNPKCR